ncbi:MAG TPA: Stp1/IreP family PP2C-type Ser/Thr phosphatase [Syntrophomonas sp.]|nr:Stp1/IreP family PP2C-type Ser/Thr phosphatase [Syntrophomonas sp.]HRW12919.1 Stp1/IreP family PP2C-type Ser/Thr phosphatase [Syntrophomonas sp.]
MKAAGLTDIGLVRKRNEDNYWLDTDYQLFVVCDGMGGHLGGDIASRLAIETITRELIKEDLDEFPAALEKAVQSANRIIWETGQATSDLNEMGTTLTAAVIRGNSIWIAHVGDSSLYIIHDAQITKPTSDHTLAEQMRKDGLIAKDDERYQSFHHVLVRALGVENQVDIDIHQMEVTPGDWILLCTDGLSNLVEQTEIKALLEHENEPQTACQKLLELALARGGYDNITIILIQM